MKIHLTLPYLLLLTSLNQLACAFEANSLRQESETVYPHIVEYIDNFTLNTNDLEGTLNNQLHNIKLSEVQTSYAHITNSTVSLSHYGSERRLEYLTPLKAKVTNDSFSVFVMFDIRVLHTLGGKNYSCNTSIPLVYVNYTKEIDLNTGNSVVSSLSSSYSSKGFKSAVCKQSESAKDKTRIDEAVNSTEGSSIYLELLKIFDHLQEYFTVNAKNEHLSKIYEKNPYQYDYYGFKININVSTIQATKIGANGVENRMSGSIAGTTKAAVAPPDYTPGFTSFYSLEFLKNMVAYSSANYPAWKNIKISRQNMRNRIFKFRLLDFEYLIPTILNKYPNNYMSDVLFVCDLEATRDMVINETNIFQDIDWRCKGSFETKPTVRQTFVNFVVSMRHVLQISFRESAINVYVSDLSITNLNFDIIADYAITDSALFTFFIEEGLFEFHVYTIGTFFRTNNPNQIMKLEPGRGIWIG